MSTTKKTDSITDASRLKGVWLKLQWITEHPDLGISFIRRDLALTIYEMKHHWTGKTSKTLCNEDNYRLTFKGSKYTKEHYHNLKKYCIKLCEDFIAGKIDTIEKLQAEIDVISQVHYVTQEENKRLSVIQTAHPDKTWEEHYEMAGIVLVDEVGTFNSDTGKITKIH